MARSWAAGVLLAGSVTLLAGGAPAHAQAAPPGVPVLELYDPAGAPGRPPVVVEELPALPDYDTGTTVPSVSDTEGFWSTPVVVGGFALALLVLGAGGAGLVTVVRSRSDSSGTHLDPETETDPRGTEEPGLVEPTNTSTAGTAPTAG